MFQFTPEEAQSTALAVAKHLSKSMKLFVERPYSNDAPYRTTLLAEVRGLKTLVEAQSIVNYHREIRDLARWLLAKRAYAELYLATPQQSGLPTEALQDMISSGESEEFRTDCHTGADPQVRQMQQ